MYIYSLEDALNKIAEIVNQCLGPLGSEGFTFDNIRDFLIQLASTIILFLIVRFFLWKPLTNYLEKRQAAIDAELVDAKNQKEEATLLANKTKEEYQNARLEIAKLLDEAKNEANLEKEAILKEAQIEAENRLKQAHQEIEKEVSDVKDKIKKEIVDVAFMAASKIIEKEINTTEYLELVENIIKEASL